MNTLTDIKPTTQHDFLTDVIEGLAKPQKTIPCKWFYDEVGSIVFEEITETPEYYPTRVETKLLVDVAQDLQSLLPALSAIIEPGSGSSIKTRLLLGSQKALQTYIPMDISKDFLNFITEQLHLDYPHINTIPLIGDFTNINGPFEAITNSNRLVFFPGSTIGNFSPGDAKDLLESFHHLAGDDGHLLIGVDGTQDASQLLAAYNDAQGVTAIFNKNLLVRANAELNANFAIDQFEHFVLFNAEEQRVEMHLKSLKAQTVNIGEASFSFKEDETIFTESCYKYNQAQFMALAKESSWALVKCWKDMYLSDFQLFLLKSTK